MPPIGQEVRLNLWPAWALKNVWLLLQELTPVSWSQIPAWVIPFCLSKIPHLFQTDAIFFSLPSLKTAKQLCMVGWVLAGIYFKGSYSTQWVTWCRALVHSMCLWGKFCSCLFIIRTAKYYHTELRFGAMVCSKQPPRVSTEKILSHGEMRRVWSRPESEF